MRSPNTQNYIRPKRDSNHHKTDLFQQIVKLTKQNQYLHTKIDCLFKELETIAHAKNKYRKKYKQMKIGQQHRGNIQNVIYHQIKTKKNFPQDSYDMPSTKSNHPDPYSIQNIEDPYRLMSNNTEKGNSKILQSIKKIDCAIMSINEQICFISKNIQPVKYQELWCRIDELGENLNSLVQKLQMKDNRQRSHSINTPNNSQHFGVMSGQYMQIPVKDKKKLDIRPQSRKLIQSRSQKSVEYQMLKNGRVLRQRVASQNFRNNNKEEWKTLKQIGLDLKNWKFQISQTSKDMEAEKRSTIRYQY